MVVHTIIPSLRRLRQEDDTYKTSVGYVLRACFKQNERDIRKKKSRMIRRKEDKDEEEKIVLL